MTSSDPDVIRRQIEDTRRELSYDVDALNEKVNPARVMDRRGDAPQGGGTPGKGKGMGTASPTPTPAPDPAVGAVQQAPDTIVRQTQGNPLAAGMIAFGVGWLVSILLPASEKEKQLAQQAESAVKEHKDALLEPAKN